MRKAPILQESRNAKTAACNQVGKRPPPNQIIDPALIKELDSEEQLNQSEMRFRSYFESPLVGMAITSPDRNWLEINDQLCSMLGYTRQELLNMTWSELTHPDDLAHDVELLNLLIRGEIDRVSADKRYIRKDGEAIWVNLAVGCIRGSKDVLKQFAVSMLDITDRKLAERERETTIELLGLINAQTDTRELLNAVARLLRKWSGFDAVGIRMREQCDFPYVAHTGFDEAFLWRENMLCAVDKSGEPVHDRSGNPFLECICGDVLSGRLDLGRPSYTARGSFWTNSLSKLYSELDYKPKEGIRNSCRELGYESVALIPLRLGEETFGLVQLSDSRAGRFSERIISFLEGMADSLAIALSQHSTKAELQKTKDELDLKVRERTSQLSEINRSLLAEIEGRKRTEKVLRSAQKNLRAMAAEIVLMDEKSRQGLATDLHDTVVQTLGAAKMRSELLREYVREEGARHFTELQNMISQSITEARFIMAEMSPPVLYELGFIPAIEWLTEQIDSHHDLIIKFQASQSFQPVMHEIQVLLFQATRELLMNVVKHANAEEALVRISGDQKSIRIEVSDNGKGFNGKVSFRADTSSGFGLFSIRERLRHLGGRLTIQSEPGKGTRINISAPRLLER